jgi:hypothetical protein
VDNRFALSVNAGFYSGIMSVYGMLLALSLYVG